MVAMVIMVSSFLTHPELAVLALPLSRERGAKPPQGGWG